MRPASRSNCLHQTIHIFEEAERATNDWRTPGSREVLDHSVASRTSIKVRRRVEQGRERSIEMCWQSSPLSSCLSTKKCTLATLIIQQVHEQMLHGGVSTTMCRMREKYWKPKLRSLPKKVICNCNICRRYWKKPISTLHRSDSILPVFRTELSNPFAVTGVDFAGPVNYKINKSTTS